MQAGLPVIWSMSYAGGVSAGIDDRDEVLAIYGFLRKALLAARADRPFRGPSHFENGSFRYLNMSQGNVAEFHGEEQIDRAGMKVYSLRYGGGIIR